MTKKVVVECPVLENYLLGSNIYKMIVYAPDICRQAKPGQFVQVKTGRLDSPLLRRPISIADIIGDKLVLIYRVVGEGTKWLSECQIGQTVDILGSLGNGFKLTGKKPLLVGGGIGIAPLLYVARQSCPMPVEVLLAGRTAQEMFWTGLFEETCQNMHITTDDGSMGIKGNVTAALPDLLQKGGFDVIYSCGPEPMLAAVSKIAQEYKVECQLSLERYMACGLGACLSCACEDNKGKRLKVCLNGPVFAAGEVEGL